MTTSTTPKNNTLSILIAVSISEMINKKRVEVGVVQVPTPSLEDLGIEGGAQLAPNKDGSLNYESHTSQFIYAGVLARSVTKQKNKLAEKSIEFKLGASFDTDLTTLTAPPSIGGNPEALTAIAAFKTTFRAYLVELGTLSADAQAFLNKCVQSADSIRIQSEAIKPKIAARLAAFVDTSPACLVMADGTDNPYTVRYLNNLIEATESAELDLSEL